MWLLFSGRLPLIAVALILVNAIRSTLATNAVDLTAIDYIFSFGDSYSASFYDPSTNLLNISNISTTSGGSNWIEYLAANSPITMLNQFDLAIGGSTINESVVTLAGSSSFIDQVAIFEQFFTPAPASVPWASSNTLFTIWFGINDVGYSYLLGDDFAALLPQIMTSYVSMISTLYSAGARNFLIMGLPPTDRTPLVQTYSESVIMLFKSNLLDFNGALYDAVTTTLSEQLPEIVVALYDTQPIFNDILDNPTEYGFSNVTGICDDYVNITAQPDIYSPECYYPLSEYMWKNSYHPSWKVHQIMATLIENQLTGENIPLPTSAISSITSPTPTAPIPDSLLTSQSAVVTFAVTSTASGSTGTGARLSSGQAHPSAGKITRVYKTIFAITLAIGLQFR